MFFHGQIWFEPHKDCLTFPPQMISAPIQTYYRATFVKHDNTAVTIVVQFGERVV